MNEQAAQVTVEEDLAVFFDAALLSEKVQYACSDVRGEGLVEVISRRHEVQQTLPSLAARVEALGDVEGVSGHVLFILETEALQGGDDLCRGAVLGDGVNTELLAVRLPQGVPATII